MGPDLSRSDSEASTFGNVHNSLDTNSQHNNGRAEFAPEWRRISGTVSGPRRCACCHFAGNLERFRSWTAIILTFLFRPLSNIRVWAYNGVHRLELMLDTQMNGFPLLFPPLRCKLSRNQFLPPCILGHRHQKTSNFTSAHLFWMLIDNLNASTYRGTPGIFFLPDESRKSIL